MIVDEPDAIMWESEIVQPEFHFFINKKSFLFIFLLIIFIRNNTKLTF